MHGVPFGLPGVATDPLGPRACRSVMGAVPVDPGPVRFQAKPHKTLKEAGSRKLGIFDSVLSNECYINNNDAPLTEQHNVARKATLSSWPASRRRGYGMTDKTDDILASVEASSRSRCSRTCRIMQPESKALRELTADDEASADREELKFLTEQAARIRQRLQAQAQQLRVPPIQAAAMLQPELQLQPQVRSGKTAGRTGAGAGAIAAAGAAGPRAVHTASAFAAAVAVARRRCMRATATARAATRATTRVTPVAGERVRAASVGRTAAASAGAAAVGRAIPAGRAALAGRATSAVSAHGLPPPSPGP